MTVAASRCHNLLAAAVLTAGPAPPQSIVRETMGHTAAAAMLERGLVMGLFAKAKQSKATSTTTKTKGVSWLTGDPQGDAVAKSVKELVRLSAEAKAVEAKMGIHKTVVKKYAEDRYVGYYAAEGTSPDTPMVVQNTDGEKVTYVVQDRSSQYAVKDEQKEALAQLLGPDAVDGLLYEEVSFGFNREIMSVPGVQEVVEKALESAIKKLTAGPKPVLTETQAEALIDVEQKTTFKPGTLDRLTMIVGQDTGRIKQFLDVMGASATRYIKV